MPSQDKPATVKKEPARYLSKLTGDFPRKRPVHSILKYPDYLSVKAPTGVHLLKALIRARSASSLVVVASWQIHIPWFLSNAYLNTMHYSVAEYVLPH